MNPDLIVFKNLIAYYVERQRLVVLALIEVCPIVFRGNPTVLGIDLIPYLEAYEARRYTQIGVWKHDWDYRHHGMGCELTHIHTGEYFNWDAPDPEAFYMGIFSDHLDWRIKHEADDPCIQAYRRRGIPFEMIWDLALHKGLIQRQESGLDKWVKM